MNDKVIVLNGEEYLVCNDIVVDNVNYLYVVSLDGNKFSLLIRQNINGEDIVESVTDENLVKRILEIIANQENN